MAPYRSREEPRAPRAAPQTGLVADMVRQFSDSFAFVRELVQNGIDAGTTSLEVTVERAAGGATAVRVADDGCGMTLSVIEDALLVLFRSTKDQDPTKIGKYGVGFMSVFAIEPSEVTVDTWREGLAHRLRLLPDHTYEIERMGRRDGQGTIVTLCTTVAAGDFEGFWRKARASLHRWCRHAEVPIHFTVTDAASRAPPRRERVDAPLDVRAVVRVRRVYDDMEIVLGPVAGSGGLPDTGTEEDRPAPFAGFYNRGLTLHETTSGLHLEIGARFVALDGVRFKAKSRLFCHTLSRDDVQRDRAFSRAVSRALELAAAELPAAALRELGEAASEVAEGGTGTRFERLLEAATCLPVSADATRLALPLAHPIDGRSTLELDRISAAFGRCFGSSAAWRCWPRSRATSRRRWPRAGCRSCAPRGGPSRPRWSARRTEGSRSRWPRTSASS